MIDTFPWILHGHGSYNPLSRYMCYFVYLVTVLVDLAFVVQYPGFAIALAAVFFHGHFGLRLA